jgi:uncharacterized protein (TIGR03492 family)
MKLLCISNGHGEDSIAVQILKALRRLPAAPTLAALPLVGEGGAYQRAGIPLVGPTQTLPSGGFIYMDGQQAWRDIRGGLLSLTRGQLATVRQWAESGGHIFAVGDIVPLAFAWWSGTDYSFLGTAKSEYFLRDEAGPLPHRPWLEGWSGSVYLPWERWLMQRQRCRAVFVRDQLTADTLKRWQIPAVYAGNPMMDDLAAASEKLARLTAAFFPAEAVLTVALLPGSRAPEALDNWQLILRSLPGVMATFADRQVRWLAAIAPALNPVAFQDTLIEQGWNPVSSAYPTFQRENGVLMITQDTFAECLHLADTAIATAGTATEQMVGLGKPVFTLAGRGPQFTRAFAEVQARLLGSSVVLVTHPDEVAAAMQACLQDAQRLQQIARNGHHRLGDPGAARQIAQALHQLYGEED